jgi:CubicO group peptidase (beta-lactamase class C family)
MDILGLSDLPFLPSIVTRCEIPEDLASVQTIDEDAEVSPIEVGLEPDAVDHMWAAALRWYRSGIHPAISVCIRVRGQVVLKRSIGYSHGGGPNDPEGTPKVKVTPETPFNVFSASKPMAAMVIHLLDQRHQLHLDDPVCEYIPEFAQHRKEWVTIRHVLTHRAGIPVIPEAALDLTYLEDFHNKEAIKLLCESRRTSRAGGRLAYHAVTGGFILGEIVRRITGKNIRAVVDEEFCQRFGWRWMNFGVKKRDVDKVASSYFTGFPLVTPLRSVVHSMLGVDFIEAVELSNDPRYLMGVLPAANLIATADEMSQFYQMLLDGGTYGGKRLFEARTVWRAISEQSYGELDFTLGVPLRYGMGFMLGGEYLSLYGFGTNHAFGHLGLTNIIAWADPVRHVSASIMTSGKPVLYPEMHRAFGLAYAIAAVCPKDDDVVPRPREEARPRAKRKRTARTDKSGAPVEAQAPSKPSRKKSASAGERSKAEKPAKTKKAEKAAMSAKPAKAPKPAKKGIEAKPAKPAKADGKKTGGKPANPPRKKKRAKR